MATTPKFCTKSLYEALIIFYSIWETRNLIIKGPLDAYVMYFEKSKSHVDLQNDLKIIVNLFDKSSMIYHVLNNTSLCILTRKSYMDTTLN